MTLRQAGKKDPKEENQYSKKFVWNNSNFDVTRMYLTTILSVKCFPFTHVYILNIHNTYHDNIRSNHDNYITLCSNVSLANSYQGDKRYRILVR